MVCAAYSYDTLEESAGTSVSESAVLQSWSQQTDKVLEGFSLGIEESQPEAFSKIACTVFWR